jgi:hypothetical protein
VQVQGIGTNCLPVQVAAITVPIRFIRLHSFRQIKLNRPKSMKSADNLKSCAAAGVRRERISRDGQRENSPDQT